MNGELCALNFTYSLYEQPRLLLLSESEQKVPAMQLRLWLHLGEV